MELSELHRNKCQRLPRDTGRRDVSLVTEQLHSTNASVCPTLLPAAISLLGRESEAK